MAKLAHILVSVLLSVFAVGVWFLLVSAHEAFRWHIRDGVLHSYTMFCLQHRNFLFLAPIFGGGWIAFIFRRPSVTIDSAFVYFLFVAIFSVTVLVAIGVAMIYARMLTVF